MDYVTSSGRREGKLIFLADSWYLQRAGIRACLRFASVTITFGGRRYVGASSGAGVAQAGLVTWLQARCIAAESSRKENTEEQGGLSTASEARKQQGDVQAGR